MIEVDARGLSCPEPVMRTKNALAGAPGELTVLVDNNVAKENVIKLLWSEGYQVDLKLEDEDIFVYGKK